MQTGFCPAWEKCPAIHVHLSASVPNKKTVTKAKDQDSCYFIITMCLLLSGDVHQCPGPSSNIMDTATEASANQQGQTAALNFQDQQQVMGIKDLTCVGSGCSLPACRGCLGAESWRVALVPGWVDALGPQEWAALDDEGRGHMVAVLDERNRRCVADAPGGGSRDSVVTALDGGTQDRVEGVVSGVRVAADGGGPGGEAAAVDAGGRGTIAIMADGGIRSGVAGAADGGIRNRPVEGCGCLAQSTSGTHELFSQQGVHTVQYMYGCELDDDGTNRGYEQLGYDGEDFLILDLNTVSWIASTPQACVTKQKWERAGDAMFKVAYLENECIEWLQKYVAYGRSTLYRKVRPEVSLFRKNSSSPVVCHATGFFPKAVNISWQKNGEDLNEDMELRETLPNQDGTFQKRSILTVSPEELNSNQYTCVVQHSSLQKEMVLLVHDHIVMLGGVLLGVIVGAVVAVLLLVNIACVGAFIWKKKSDFKPVPVSQPVQSSKDNSWASTSSFGSDISGSSTNDLMSKRSAAAS